MIPRSWFNDPRLRWWAFGLMLTFALVELYIRFHDFGKPPRAPLPDDPAIYASLENNSSRHGGIAQWAHQFMRLDEAAEILNSEGYKCDWYEKRSGIKCARELTLPAVAHVEIKAENGFVRFARGYYESTRYPKLGRYFESAMAAPGFEFADANSLAQYMAGRLRLPDLAKPDPAKPVKVGDYRRAVAFFKEMGMPCSDEYASEETGLPEMHCTARSLAGHEQKIVLRLSDDALPAQLEGILGGQRAAVALAGQPLPNPDGLDEVLVRDALKPARLMAVVAQPEFRAFTEKFAATYAALDEPSKRRVLRLIARQLDERFKADEDDALRPLLQQLDYGALFVRRVGEMRGGREIARESDPKTYVAFALAECDARPASEARACFLEYENLRPALRQLLDQAVAEVKSAHPGLDSRHPVMERLARLEPFTSVR